MPFSSKKPNRQPEQFYAQDVMFISEQEGSSESDLKKELTTLFLREGVRKAYLVKMSYADSVPASVVLCLWSTVGSEKALVEKISEIFASMFARQEHLDIMFLSGAQEARLSNQCSPFFESII